MPALFSCSAKDSAAAISASARHIGTAEIGGIMARAFIISGGPVWLREIGLPTLNSGLAAMSK